MPSLLETLTQLRSGDQAALAWLEPAVYDQLRRVAAQSLRQERPGHTLQPTALVHEAYLRLAKGSELAFADRSHLLGICARVMRRILIDHARARRAEKRGGDQPRITLDDARHGGEDAPGLDLLALEEALQGLAEVNERCHQVVELRFFGGLTTKECAEVLGVSVRTIGDDWSFARAWLSRALDGEMRA